MSEFDDQEIEIAGPLSLGGEETEPAGPLSLAQLPTLAALGWFAVNHHGDTAHVTISGEIAILGDSVDLLIAQIGAAPKVELWINSPGGDAVSADKIAAALAGRHVEAFITGNCFSAAMSLALAASKIRMLPDAKMLVHSARACVWGTASELEKRAIEIRILNSKLRKILRKRTGQPMAVIRNWLAGGDFYFSAAEAIAIGLADEIFDAQPAIPGDGGTIPPPGLPTGQTEDEILFGDMLRAFGSVAVRDQSKFVDSVARWAFYNSTVKN